jgi:hypothetical protein
MLGDHKRTKGLVPIPQGAVQVEQDCLNHRSSVYGVDDSPRES